MTKILKQLTKDADQRDQHLTTEGDQVNQLLLDVHEESEKGLESIGMTQHLDYHRKMKEEAQRSQYAKDVYNTSEFIGEELAQMCHKWNMRVLPVQYYCGEIPPELGRVSAEFVEKYNIDPKEKKNFFMLAPTEMFNTETHTPRLVVKPQKDPILLYRTYPHNDYDNTAHRKDRFIPVHSWGNDFKWHRKFWWIKSNYKENSSSASIKSSIITATVFFLMGLIILGIAYAYSTPGYSWMVYSIGGLLSLVGVIGLVSTRSEKDQMKSWWNQAKHA